MIALDSLEAQVHDQPPSWLNPAASYRWGRVGDPRHRWDELLDGVDTVFYLAAKVGPNQSMRRSPTTSTATSATADASCRPSATTAPTSSGWCCRPRWAPSARGAIAATAAGRTSPPTVPRDAPRPATNSAARPAAARPATSPSRDDAAARHLLLRALQERAGEAADALRRGPRAGAGQPALLQRLRPAPGAGQSVWRADPDLDPGRAGRRAAARVRGRQPDPRLHQRARHRADQPAGRRDRDPDRRAHRHQLRHRRRRPGSRTSPARSSRPWRRRSRSRSPASCARGTCATRWPTTPACGS